MCYWKQWKKTKARYENLKKLGIKSETAWTCSNTRKSYWRLSNNKIINKALDNKTLESFGYTSLSSVYC